VLCKLYHQQYTHTPYNLTSCNGNLLSSLFIVLKETNIFGPRVQETLFTPNVIVKASKSENFR